MRGTKEFYEIMDEFEKASREVFYGHKIERVSMNEDVPNRVFYNDGFVNQMFQMYMRGYQHAKCSANLGELTNQ